MGLWLNAAIIEEYFLIISKKWHQSKAMAPLARVIKP